MGNFSVSHYTAIRIDSDVIELRYLLDLAEIPTFQEIRETGIVAEVDHPSLRAYLDRQAERLREGLRLEVDGRHLALRTESREAIFPPGAGGLPTMKLGFVYRARLTDPTIDGLHRLLYHDDNLPDRVGWKEVIAMPGAGIVLASSSVPEKDRSSRLTDYPTDLLSSPPQDLEARVVFASGPVTTSAGPKPGTTPPARAPERPTLSEGRSPTTMDRAEDAGVAAPVELHPNKRMTPRDAFTELVASREVGFSMLLIAAVVAAGLGALHALEPGHGKAVVAAYLVGSRGTGRHAIVLGLTVTLSHTAGVYLLGGMTLYASRYVVPERIYPWLAAISGLVIAGMGVLLFRRHYLGNDAHRSHEHDHHSAASRVSLRDLAALGVSGGIVPCPAALVVLLSAFAMRRTGFGLFLILAFSIGLAAVLIAVGLLMVYARQLMARVKSDGPLVTRWLPLTSAAVVTFLGVALAVQALARAGIPALRL
jgi:nickel/cobalt exporter